MASFRAARPVAFTLLALVASARADFLGKQRGGEAARVAKSPLEESDLLTELEKAVGYDLRAATQARVESLESAVWPLFKALPQQGSGKIGADAVRYVLHRLFVQRHGWFVRGLETEGGAWNSSSPVAVFTGHFDDQVQGIFERHLNDHGFGVHQVAVMAAMLESFVHQEVMERLAAAYRVLGFVPQQEGLAEEEAMNIMDAYMLMYVLGLNHNSVTRAEFDEQFRTAEEVYPAWPETVTFVRELRQSLLAGVDGDAERTSWQSNMQVLEEMGNQYGEFQNRECGSLKQTLVGLDATGSGRVPMDKFYGSALSENKWQFLESVQYLQQLGALDDSDESRMSVIIPNYVNSLTNCLASSKFYSVCCIDECDPLLQKLEHAVGAPEATPQQLASLVTAMSSSTVKAPRQLSHQLRRKLDEVADSNGGKILLHGRLFAQWMHHAFPRECPYPHVSGTTRPQTPLAWMETTGEDIMASEEDMRRLINGANRRPPPAARDEIVTEGEHVMQWTDEEELFIGRPVELPEPARPLLSRMGKGMTLFAVPFSLSLVLLRAFGPVHEDPLAREKYSL
eukprot:TRINITY_DN2214_c1_g1_i1.p1 TRINITY_DN2214_c1_g1~~TRINITY_DN2214_c1_g1_i1.p1  ORF type:complete len:568 (-),score=147.23 TRINITY_DN2214_c1_g1_i1:84-1787(-)